MDIMSAYCRYHTPTGGVTSPPSSLFNRNANPSITHPLDSVGSIDRIIGLLPNGNVHRPMATDFGGGQRQSITAVNAQDALHNFAGHRTGSTSARPASVCNFYRIDGSYSFIHIEGNLVSYAGIHTILCVQFPLVQPRKGPVEALNPSAIHGK